MFLSFISMFPSHSSLSSVLSLFFHFLQVCLYLFSSSILIHYIPSFQFSISSFIFLFNSSFLQQRRNEAGNKNKLLLLNGNSYEFISDILGYFSEQIFSWYLELHLWRNRISSSNSKVYAFSVMEIGSKFSVMRWNSFYFLWFLSPFLLTSSATWSKTNMAGFPVALAPDSVAGITSIC
jgi:hypothetical protein